MSIAIVTGSSGLIGSASVRHFAKQGFDVIGIDNDMRAYFFGEDASTRWNQRSLESDVRNFTHVEVDIRDASALHTLFGKYGSSISLIVHTAAQPSHDWAAREPVTDFTINALGTLNLLEAFRKHSPDACFIFTSTNKVYGDTPNLLPLVERETRWEIDSAHKFFGGIDETMSIDQSTHSLFGASKTAADLLVQEYGRYFGLKTVSFRGGCLTGPSHSGAQLHGFLSYLVHCVSTDKEYSVFGYKGKQVRDNIHSEDLIRAFDEYVQAPRCGEVYNMGGGRFSNCSVIEAMTMAGNITGRSPRYQVLPTARTGDHQWYISDLKKFQNHYPLWQPKWDVESIIRDIYAASRDRWASISAA